MPLTITSMIILMISTRINMFSIKAVFPWMLLFSMFFVSNVDLFKYDKGFNTISYYIVLLFFMILLVGRHNWHEILYKICIVFSLIHAIATIVIFVIPDIYQLIRPFISAQNIMYEGYKTGLTGHYSTNAIYISIGLIASASALISDNKKEKKDLIIVLVFSMALMLTTKRGQLIFSVLAIFICYILIDNKRLGKRITKIFGVGLTIVVGTYFASFFIPELSEVFERFDGGVLELTSGRNVMYALALRIFLANPILGAGMGAYKYQYATYIANDINHMYLNTHNVYLQLLCENGIVGLFIFCFAAFSTLVLTIHLMKKCFNDIVILKFKRYIVFSACFQMYFLLYCLSGNPLYDSMMYFVYFLCCAIPYSVKLYLRNTDTTR